MQSEIKTSEDNTRALVPLPKGKKAIGYKWVYKINTRLLVKLKSSKLDLWKKGYNQKEGSDYQETFSPMVKMVIVRSVLSIATSRHQTIHQMDVYNVYLQGDLFEQVYMIVPHGFNDSTNKSLVCKLLKSLYGLKQASRQQNIKLTTSLQDFNFKQRHLVYSLFIKRVAGKLVVVLV